MSVTTNFLRSGASTLWPPISTGNNCQAAKMDIIWIAVSILLGLSRLDERLFWVSIGVACFRHGFAISIHPLSPHCMKINPKAVANTEAERCLKQEPNKARQLCRRERFADDTLSKIKVHSSVHFHAKSKTASIAMSYFQTATLT